MTSIDRCQLTEFASSWINAKKVSDSGNPLIHRFAKVPCKKLLLKEDWNCSYLKITVAHDVKYTIVSVIFLNFRR